MRYTEIPTIAGRIAYIREAIAKSDQWLMRALWVVYQNQTADEQSVGSTSHDNGIGFTAFDAEILTSFAQQVERKGFTGQLPKGVNIGMYLSPKQQTLLRKKMPKYARQLELQARPETD